MADRAGDRKRGLMASARDGFGSTGPVTALRAIVLGTFEPGRPVAILLPSDSRLTD